MNERETLWIGGNGTYACNRWELHAATRMGGSVLPTSERTIYGEVSPSFEGKFSASYWKLKPLHEGCTDDPLLRGDWVDLPDLMTLEEATAVLENIVRLDLGGWP